ncbi:hypothetical protein PsorP6_014172 [Peronosclerospora sorghi]|uniref:Uncharacterized protein n=1 Tax=Peronosclerospora sorghi TaxID=230839 RepID=A0ACC0VFV8_9STRA|nr:hypothetical protein PsorP6_014172 [Peronosclerospora sorghi]
MSIQNVNVGVLGHVDSGKTSLVRALSRTVSTAALDKDPQSQARGMTLDLGFSSFCLEHAEGPSLQVTLVDCPGHASLFRTIVAGVAIIDAVLLVVDACKGMQAQTIESFVLASLKPDARMIVALTKIDLVAGAAARIDQLSQEIQKFLATHFQVLAVPIVPVTVKTGHESTHGIANLVRVLQRTLKTPLRDTSGPFYLAVDHCFHVRGHGTVLTGTVVAGKLAQDAELEIVPPGIQTKVKTLQVFKRQVPTCAQGDRVGVRVQGLDATRIERALAVSPPGSLPCTTHVILRVTRVPFFRGATCKSGAKCHATLGHATSMATATFFTPLQPCETRGDETHGFHPSRLYEYVPTLDSLATAREHERPRPLFALLEFNHAVFCPPNALIVCARLDLDVKRFPCRVAFHGTVRTVVAGSHDELKVLACVHPYVVDLAAVRIGRVKSRDGSVDKVIAPRGGTHQGGAREVIGRDMFPKTVKWSVYQDLVVLFPQSRRLGTILGPFGKAGKFRIALLPHPLEPAIPVSGEKVVLRVLKLLRVKSSSVKEKTSKFTANVAPGASNHRFDRASGSSLLQDLGLLYPECLGISSTSAPAQVTMNAAAPSPVKSSALAQATRKAQVPARAHRGKIERLKGKTTADRRNPFAIVSGLFRTEQEAQEAVGAVVQYVTRDEATVEFGTIEKPFGKAGKVRVEFQEGGGTTGQEGDTIEMVG